MEKLFSEVQAQQTQVSSESQAVSSDLNSIACQVTWESHGTMPMTLFLGVCL